MVIAEVAGEHLGLVSQSTKRTAVHNAIAIALEWATVWVCGFSMLATSRVGLVHRERGELGVGGAASHSIL